MFNFSISISPPRSLSHYIPFTSALSLPFLLDEIRFISLSNITIFDKIVTLPLSSKALSCYLFVHILPFFSSHYCIVRGTIFFFTSHVKYLKGKVAEKYVHIVLTVCFKDNFPFGSLKNRVDFQSIFDLLLCLSQDFWKNFDLPTINFLFTWPFKILFFEIKQNSFSEQSFYQY